MAVERCCVCDALVDLDTNVEGIVYLGDKAYCPECIDYDELIEEYQTIYDTCSKQSRKIANLQRELERYKKAVGEMKDQAEAIGRMTIDSQLICDICGAVHSTAKSIARKGEK